MTPATSAPLMSRTAAVHPVVQSLFVHPLKGARPVAVPVMQLDDLGAVGDRRWMLVDQSNVVITPREVAGLAQLVATLPLHADGSVRADSPLTLTAAGRPLLTVHHAADDGPHLTVQCWDDVLEMADAGDVAATWCSATLGVACRLVHMSARSHRALAAKYAGNLPYAGREVSVTDGAPLLLLGTASLDALNERLRADGQPPVAMDRFRANVMLSTTQAHVEDNWSRITIGNVSVSIGSPCPRCVVTTIDPATLSKSVEPLRTLATYRRALDGKVMFGMNATHLAPGRIAVGERVAVEVASVATITAAER